MRTRMSGGVRGARSNAAPISIVVVSRVSACGVALVMPCVVWCNFHSSVSIGRTGTFRSWAANLIYDFPIVVNILHKK